MYLIVNSLKLKHFLFYPNNFATGFHFFAIISETLRLYPVFPILPRVAINDYKVPETDFTIEKNTLVLVSNMGIQRDPEYYPNPDQFDPERFSVENKSNRPFVAHIPFGEGPRICVGKHFIFIFWK